ncbi:MAG TPA: hypothetical protein PKA00_13410 [Saprospiraceae bacterium]|nr:hypothetical protein [Saprospiraceae bacterium]HMQ83907.1 hypothetical protein [Saprospiraceae bacterium]
MYTILRYDLPMFLVLTISNYIPDFVRMGAIRGALVRPFFRKCGKRLVVFRNVQIINPSLISLGNDVGLGFFSSIEAREPVVVESEVMLGPFAKISALQQPENPGKGVHLKFGSWLGANAIASSGTVLGMGAIIGACACAQEEIPDHALFVASVQTELLKNGANG